MWATSESLLTDVVTSPDGWYMKGMPIEMLETRCSSDEIGVFSDEFWSTGTVGFSNGVSRMLGSSAERERMVGFSSWVDSMLGFSAAVPRNVGFSGEMGGML